MDTVASVLRPMQAADIIATVLAQPDLDAIGREPVEARGIINSEMALIIAMCRHYRIQVLIESGRCRAQSTYMAAKYLPDVTIFSTEMSSQESQRPPHEHEADANFGSNRVADLPNVVLMEGRGESIVPGVVGVIRNFSRMAILLDGPKGIDALNLMDSVFGQSGDVRLAFIHDLPRHSSSRAEAGARQPAFFTDDEDYVKATRHLDDGFWAANPDWRPYHWKGRDTGSYCWTLGMFRNGDAA